MVSERQKYISNLLRTFGLAFFTPLASITFQAIVFEKGAYLGYFIPGVLLFLLGWIFIGGGYIFLKEK